MQNNFRLKNKQTSKKRFLHVAVNCAPDVSRTLGSEIEMCFCITECTSPKMLAEM